jgi:hypothetical protein
VPRARSHGPSEPKTPALIAQQPTGSEVAPCFSRAVRKWAGRRGWFGALPPGVDSADDGPFLRQGQAVVGLRLSGAPCARCATPSWAWGIVPGG